MSEYLAIKNWAKFQSLKGRSLWRKEWTTQGDDPAINALSLAEFGFLVKMRDLCARTMANVRHDIDYIMSACQINRRDRSHVRQHIDALILAGLLIPTNQQHSFLNEAEQPPKIREDKTRKEEKREEENAPRSARGNEVFEKAWKSYPRKDGKSASRKEWAAAVTRESKKRVATYAEHEDFIYQRVMQYAAMCDRIHKPREYIPYMERWLKKDRFLDDPSEWASASENGSAPVVSKLQESLNVIDNIEFGDQADVPRNASPVSAPKIRA